MSRKIEARILVHAERVKGAIIVTLESKYKTRTGLTFHSLNGEHFDLLFIIQPNDFGLKFQDRPQAFRVGKEGNPITPNYDEQLHAFSVSADRKRLGVRNHNQLASNYSCLLNFDSDADGGVSCDLVIVNQNGDPKVRAKGGSGKLWGTAAGVFGAVAAMIGIKKLVDRRRRTSR